MDMHKSRYRVPMRMAGWLISTGALLAFIAFKSPQQLPVIAYKLLLVCIAAYVAHRLDRTFFKDKMPSECDEIARAIVFVGVVLGLTLGV